MEFKILIAFVLLMPLSLIFLPDDLFADVVVVDWVTFDKPDHRDACEFVQDTQNGLAYDHCFFDENTSQEGRYVAYSTTPETREKRENFRILGGGDDSQVTIPHQPPTQRPPFEQIPLSNTTDINSVQRNANVQVRYFTEGLYGTRNYKYYNTNIPTGDICPQINALPRFEDCQYRYYNPSAGHFVEATFVQNSQ
jgi:hypothetical protein